MEDNFSLEFIPMFFVKWAARIEHINLISRLKKKVKPFFFSIQFDSQAIDPLSIGCKTLNIKIKFDNKVSWHIGFNFQRFFHAKVYTNRRCFAHNSGFERHYSIAKSFDHYNLAHSKMCPSVFESSLIQNPPIGGQKFEY